MATKCWTSVRGRVMRVTRLDDCCRPLRAGTPCAVGVTDGFVSVQYSPELSEAENIEVKNANGQVCVSDPGCPSLRWINLQMTFCQVNPDVFGFMTSYPVVKDFAGDSVGLRITGKIKCDSGFALEVWTELPQQACSPQAGGRQYGYFLAPCIEQGIVGEFTIENGALDMQINARTKAGSGWGRGPYAVDAINAAGTAGRLLTPIKADEHMDMHVTTIAPPAPSCDCKPMPAPAKKAAAAPAKKAAAASAQMAA